MPLTAIAAAIVMSWIAYRFPVAVTLSLTLVILTSQLFQMLNLLPEGWDILGGGIRASDFVLVGMWGASAALILRRTRQSRDEGLIIVASLVLVGLLVVAVTRNWGAYGLSALGEFRFRYLILGLPVYLALSLRSARSRIQLATLFAWAPVVGVLAVLPLAGALRGWALDEASRFYPSAISLALLFGAIWFGLTEHYPHKVERVWVKYGALLLVSLIVVKDAHRSVWLVAGVSLALLILLRVIKVGRLWSWGLIALAGSIVVISVLGLLGSDPIGYVATRGTAFLRPADDPTTYWRLATWKAYGASILRSPLLGQGFGGYWDVYVPEMGARITISPHSVYVQTLVKLGFLGMAAILAWFGFAARALLRASERASSAAGRSRMMTVMGLIGVVGSLAYGTVYALDFWALGWIGVGLASALHSEEAEVLCGE